MQCAPPEMLLGSADCCRRQLSLFSVNCGGSCCYSAWTSSGTTCDQLRGADERCEGDDGPMEHADTQSWRRGDVNMRGKEPHAARLYLVPCVVNPLMWCEM